MTLEIHVVAHAKRKDMALALAEIVKADCMWLDDGSLGEWKNHERAWRQAAKSVATHAVILQDDAVPIDNFREHVEKAVETRPNELLSLYVGTHRPRRDETFRAIEEADKQEASWLESDTLHWGVGIVVPVGLIDEILNTVHRVRLPYDQRIGEWARKTDRSVYYTWPSLIDHADEPTVIRGRVPSQGKRVAHRVGIPTWNEKTVRIRKTNVNFLASTKDKS